MAGTTFQTLSKSGKYTFESPFFSIGNLMKIAIFPPPCCLGVANLLKFAMFYISVGINRLSLLGFATSPPALVWELSLLGFAVFPHHCLSVGNLLKFIRLG